MVLKTLYLKKSLHIAKGLFYFEKRYFFHTSLKDQLRLCLCLGSAKFYLFYRQTFGKHDLLDIERGFPNEYVYIIIIL